MKKIIAALSLLAAVQAACAEVDTVINRAALCREVAQHVDGENLPALEKMAMRLAGRRSDDGVWMSELMFNCLSDEVGKKADKREPKKLLAPFAAFAAKRRSSHAGLMHAMALNGVAWHVRGMGYSHTVKEESWGPFKRYIGQARSVLDEHEAVSRTDPQWYAARMLLSLYSGEPRGQIEALFSRGIKVSPDFYPLYFHKILALTPKWGGSLTAMLDFIEEAPRLVSKADGLAIYARLVWYAEGAGYAKVMDSPRIDWSRMKQSYGDVLDKFPTEWNAQKFFFQACSRPDKQEAKRLLTYFKSPPSEALFDVNVPVVSMCVDWASGKGPDFAMRDKETGAIKFIH